MPTIPYKRPAEPDEVLSLIVGCERLPRLDDVERSGLAGARARLRLGRTDAAALTLRALLARRLLRNLNRLFPTNALLHLVNAARTRIDSHSR